MKKGLQSHRLDLLYGESQLDHSIWSVKTETVVESDFN